jgi:hypothetical protein
VPRRRRDVLRRSVTAVVLWCRPLAILRANVATRHLNGWSVLGRRINVRRHPWMSAHGRRTPPSFGTKRPWVRIPPPRPRNTAGQGPFYRAPDLFQSRSSVQYPSSELGCAVCWRPLEFRVWRGTLVGQFALRPYALRPVAVAEAPSVGSGDRRLLARSLISRRQWIATPGSRELSRYPASRS